MSQLDISSLSLSLALALAIALLLFIHLALAVSLIAGTVKDGAVSVGVCILCLSVCVCVCKVVMRSYREPVPVEASQVALCTLCSPDASRRGQQFGPAVDALDPIRGGNPDRFN